MRALAVPLRRPVGTGAIYVAVLLLGVVALFRLPLALSPDVENPSLSVRLSWPPATAEQMEALVTSRVESEANQLRGVKEVVSVTGRGSAQVSVRFEPDTQMDRAELFLRERLSALASDLPPDLAPPQIEATVPEEMEQGEFLVVRASGPASAERLRQVLEERVVPRILAVPGVGGAEIYGGAQRELRIDLDPDVLDRGLVDAGNAMGALDRLGGDNGLGVRPLGDVRIPLVVERPLANAAELTPRPVGGSAELPIRVAELGSVRDGWETPQRLARVNGEPAVQMVIEREPGTNVIDVAERVRAQIEALADRLPDGSQLEVQYDQSERIEAELNGLGRRAGISVLAIFVVLVVAQRRVRAPFVILTTVFFSALTTFLFFRAFGLGMNLVTLSGLALAFGMAVDNSIVILENIVARSRGRNSLPRTLAATREVLFPLVAATATTAVVLMPFLYMSGELRRYYLPFIISVCLSLVASMVVALTVTPLLARWSSRGNRTPVGRGALSSLGKWPTRIYLHSLDLALRRPWIPIVSALLLFGGAVWVFQSEVDRGGIFPPGGDSGIRVSLGLPNGSDIADTDALIREFEALLLEHAYFEKGWIRQVETMVFGNRASLNARLHPAVVRSGVPQTLKDRLTQRAASVSGASISVSGYGSGYSSGSSNVSPSYQLSLKGPDFLRLGELAEDLGARLSRHPRIREVNTNASSWMVKDETQLFLRPDRMAMERLGVTMRDLVTAIQPALASDMAARDLRTENGEIRGRLRLGDGLPATPEELAAVPIPRRGAAQAEPVPLRHLLTIEERPVQAEIRRRDQQYERRVTFDFRGPGKVGNRFVRSFVEGTELPDGYVLEEGSGLYLGREEEREVWQALLLSLLLIFIVSAALFESMLFPFVALLSVPLSFTGIPFLFWGLGESFDRTAFIGLILLAGVAINNSLLLVHRAATLARRTGLVRQAARRAASERWRPILMTTATSVAGLLPLAVGGDPSTGLEWRAMAWSATAGLVGSAAVTLWIVPAMFAVLGGRDASATPSSRPFWPSSRAFPSTVTPAFERGEN